MRTLFISLALFFTACTSSSEKALEIHDELVYFKDHRTDKCFAYWKSSDTNSAETSVMASVPCDEKVERMLINRGSSSSVPAEQP